RPGGSAPERHPFRGAAGSGAAGARLRRLVASEASPAAGGGDQPGEAPAAAEVRLTLLPGRDKAVREGHPWIFSGAIAAVGAVGAVGAGVAGPPPLARVFDAAGQCLGLGFYSPRSQIRVRMLGRSVERADRAFFAARLREAMALREAVLPPATTGYRLLNAEGDGVPGWTVDRYGDVLVSQVSVAGLEALRGEAYAAAAELLPECSVLQLNALPARRAEGLSMGAAESIAGTPPAEAAFRESGFALTADLAGGQKTGFYCHQRENRRLSERLAGGGGGR